LERARRASGWSEERRQLVARLSLPITSLLFVLLVGTLGYHAVWVPIGGTWLDALFMTFTTITTIGYGEVHPLGTAGRWLTMFIATIGIGSLFYSFTVVLEYAASDQVRSARRNRRMQRVIEQMKDHFILAGIGRVGREAAAELVESRDPFVIVDPGPEVEAFALERGCPFIRGDATDDAVLERAGIKRARGLIVTTSSDATNLYVILSARLLNPKILIAARAVEDESVPKLLRAGADRAINPYAIGGRRLAHLMLNPRAVEFFETALKAGPNKLSIDELMVGPTSPVAGKTLDALSLRGRTGATVLLVVRDGAATPNPRGDFEVRAADRLLALGTKEQLLALDSLIAGDGA
jgi:voltage-gated potassium channel